MSGGPKARPLDGRVRLLGGEAHGIWSLEHLPQPQPQHTLRTCERGPLTEARRAWALAPTRWNEREQRRRCAPSAGPRVYRECDPSEGCRPCNHSPSCRWRGGDEDLAADAPHLNFPAVRLHLRGVVRQAGAEPPVRETIALLCNGVPKRQRRAARSIANMSNLTFDLSGPP